MSEDERTRAGLTLARFQEANRKLSRVNRVDAIAKGLLRATLTGGALPAEGRTSPEMFAPLSHDALVHLVYYLTEEVRQSTADIVIPIGHLAYLDPDLITDVLARVTAITSVMMTRDEQRFQDIMKDLV